MTEHIRKRAEELAREFCPPVDGTTGYPSMDQLGRIISELGRIAYADAMLRTIPIIERLMNPEHDEDCMLSISRTMSQFDPCGCTLGKARDEARKLVGP